MRIKFEDCKFSICCDQIEPNLTMDQLFQQIGPHTPDHLKEGPVVLVYESNGAYVIGDSIVEWEGNGKHHNFEFLLRVSTEEELKALIEFVDATKKRRALKVALYQIGYEVRNNKKQKQ